MNIYDKDKDGAYQSPEGFEWLVTLACIVVGFLFLFALDFALTWLV